MNRVPSGGYLVGIDKHVAQGEPNEFSRRDNGVLFDASHPWGQVSR
jgi:hypothetical protein